MRKAIWTLVARPPDLAITARPDENVAEVHVELFMPLSLQLVSKQAGIGPLIRLLALLLWHTVTATVNSIGMACRSACTCDASQHSRAKAQAQCQVHKLACQVKRLTYAGQTDGLVRVFVCTMITFLKLWCLAGQTPDAVRHLRGPPENRPLTGLRFAVSSSSRTA